MSILYLNHCACHLTLMDKTPSLPFMPSVDSLSVSELLQVRQFLRSKSWDTRVAAAQAIGAIAENVSHPTVKEIISKAEAELAALGHPLNFSVYLDLCALGTSQSSNSLTFSR